MSPKIVQGVCVCCLFSAPNKPNYFLLLAVIIYFPLCNCFLDEKDGSVVFKKNQAQGFDLLWHFLVKGYLVAWGKKKQNCPRFCCDVSVLG